MSKLFEIRPHFNGIRQMAIKICSWWLGSRVVSVLDSGAEGPGFKPQRCWVTVLGKLFTPIVPLHQAAKLVAALSRVEKVTAGQAESNGSLVPTAGFMTHVTCRLSAAPEPYARQSSMGYLFYVQDEKEWEFWGVIKNN